MHARHAFTLIELLVVVAIIVLLLALLTPALDRAVYSADLTACGAGQRGVATGLTQYAPEYNRAYPHRPTRPVNAIIPQVYWAGGDDRPYYHDYFSLDVLNDPTLGRRVDLAPEATPNSTIICSSVALYHGVAYPGQRPMNRLGDRFTWTVAGQTFAFDLLVSDYDIFLSGDTYIVQSHPDGAGNGRLVAQQDELSGLNTWTWAYWYHPGIQRKPPDFNYTYADGSVRTIEAVGIAPADERMTAIPMYHHATYFDKDYASDYRSHVPIR